MQNSIPTKLIIDSVMHIIDNIDGDNRVFWKVNFTNLPNCGMYIPFSDDEHRFVQKVHPAHANGHWECGHNSLIETNSKICIGMNNIKFPITKVYM